MNSTTELVRYAIAHELLSGTDVTLEQCAKQQVCISNDRNAAPISPLQASALMLVVIGFPTAGIKKGCLIDGADGFFDKLQELDKLRGKLESFATTLNKFQHHDHTQSTLCYFK